MPQEWTTEEQKKFLQDELPAFRRVEGRCYKEYWNILYNKWGQKWPELGSIVPGASESTILTREQHKTHSEALAKRQTQLRRWMHWHAGAGDNRAANAKSVRIMNVLLKPKKRTKRPWEVYSNTYYHTHIQPKIGKGLSITEVNQKIREMFENESPEIKEKMQKISDQQRKDKKRRTQDDVTDDLGSDEEVEAETDLATLRSNIQQCGPALQRVIDHLVRQTGWKISVLMGGPDPLDAEGGNIITSLHTGKTVDGHDFAEVYPNFDTEVVDAFGEFLERAYKNGEPTSKSVQPSTKDNVSKADKLGGDEEVIDDDVEEHDSEEHDGVCADDDNGMDDDDKEVSSATTTGPSADLASPSTARFATPPISHLATPVAPHVVTNASAGADLAIPTTHFATLPTPHLATPSSGSGSSSEFTASSTSLATPPTSHLTGPDHFGNHALSSYPSTNFMDNLYHPDSWSASLLGSMGNSTMLDARINPNNPILPDFGFGFMQSLVTQPHGLGFGATCATSDFNPNSLVSFDDFSPGVMNPFNFDSIAVPFGSPVAPALQPVNDQHSSTLLPTLPAPPPVNGSSGSPLGSPVRSKRKPKPSLRAQRDNAIGKENPPSSESDATMLSKSRGKKRQGHCPTDQEAMAKSAPKNKKRKVT